MKPETLTLAALQKMPRPELIDLAKGFNRLEGKVTKAKAALTASHKNCGKVVHVLKSEWIGLRDSGKIATSIEFKDYYKSLTGDEPTKRGGQCAGVFGALVVSAKLLTEAQFDNNPVECLTETNVILNLAQLDATHEAVKLAVGILIARPESAIEDLRELKGRFVSRNEGTGDDEKTVTVFLTEAEAQAEANRIEPSAAHAMASTLAKQDIGVLIAEIASIAQTTDDAVTAKRIVHGIVNTQKAFAANVSADGKRRFSAEELNGWALELNPPKPHGIEDYKADYQNALAKLAEVENAMLQVDASLTQKWAEEMTVSEVMTSK